MTQKVKWGQQKVKAILVRDDADIRENMKNQATRLWLIQNR